MHCSVPDTSYNIPLETGQSIALIGNNLCSRMMNYGHFETEMHLRYPSKNLIIRNMCDGGDTPGFRPHAGRYSPWAFPGAEVFQSELANFSNSKGHYETPDQWLERYEVDMILAFFGYNESFQGEDGLDNFEDELEAFVLHTLYQEYNGHSAPQLILVSPIAYEDLSYKYDLPNGTIENKNLALYTQVIREVAERNEIPFIDVFHPSQKWYSKKGDMTIDGFQLNDKGYQTFSNFLVNQIFDQKSPPTSRRHSDVYDAVMEKNWHWHDDYKNPNGVHVFGRRYNPFGPENYPDEIKKKREMTSNRDTSIWMAAIGQDYNLEAADQETHELATVETNYTVGDYGRGEARYLYGEEALASFELPDGYKIEQFASEKEFPELANPVQISFDNKGRLWIATLPTYPHYKPGDPKPKDKLIILEDTDGDNRADKRTIFADDLHLPMGFEIAPEGVYVSQGTNLKLYTDTDGDDKADKSEIILSGFDDHDTHHVISAFCADPSGAIIMGEGVFLHSNVETPYGPVRGTNGGFYRYNPARKHLERMAQLPIPNPWGTAFDKWGQCFFLETSGPDVRWMVPGSIKPRYGQSSDNSLPLVEGEHRVRPTSGAEFISSRHFPDEVQGDFLLGNVIGFLGFKQHQVIDDGAGFKLEFRQDLIKSSDPNFRIVDLEFAPDGSLYFADWHNVLIGHMQHNARDPLRDHVHGRIYRITYPSRPLVSPADIADASIPTLLDNLKLPEYRSRYRTRRELRGRNKSDVVKATSNWIDQLDPTDSNHVHHLLEALWVTWGANQINKDLLEQLLQSDNYNARAAAIKVLRYAGHEFENTLELLQKGAADEHSRVRLEAMVAATWLDPEDAMPIMNTFEENGLDKWSEAAFKRSMAHLNDENLIVEEQEVKTHLTGKDKELFIKGKELYERDAYCGTCHQHQGQGLTSAGYPPLRQSRWVNENTDRLIKLSLKGLYGPMTVLNQAYEGKVPMTAFANIMDDEEMAAVLTYVRNTFENKSSVVTPQMVAKVRLEISDKKGFYTADELLQLHPHKVQGNELILW